MAAIVGSEKAGSLDFDVIEKRRRDLKITKGVLAERAGVDQSTMWRYRQGMEPALEIAKAIADALGLSVDEITRGKGNPTPPPPPGPSTPPPQPRPTRGPRPGGES